MTITTHSHGLVADVGIVRGQALLARRSLTHVHVSDELSREVFSFKLGEMERWVMGPPRFASDCIVVPKFSKTACHGLWAWELSSGREMLNIDFASECGPFIEFAPLVDTTVFLATDPVGIALWDVATGRCRRRVHADQVVSAALHPRSRRLAYFARGSIHIVHSSGLPSESWHAPTTEWAALVWGLAGRVLVGADVQGNVFVTDVQTRTTRATFSNLGLPVTCSLDGRWIAFECGLLDLLEMRAQAHDAHRVARAGCFDTRSQAFVFADEDGNVWRVPV